MNAKIASLRKKVDKLDKSLIQTLAQRFKITNEIQKEKITQGIGLLQKKREKILLNRYLKLSRCENIPPDCIAKIFKVIFSSSKKNGIIKRTIKKSNGRTSNK